MRFKKCVGPVLAALATFPSARADTAPVAAPAPQELVPGVWMVPGGILPDRQPDGNSVIFDGPSGLIVVDTGRHLWHRQAILSLARSQETNIVAVVNTHWHLDHVSGNPDLRRAYPGLRVYASDAIDGALTGFFPASAKDSAQYLDDPQVPEATREDIRADLRTIQDESALKPDEVIATSGKATLGGRNFTINLVRDAVTAGDVWLYDDATRVAVLGDLVTLPAPFLDTACPDGWNLALDEVAAAPFEVAVPGHGVPMTRAQFLLYKSAFGAFVDCTSSDRPDDECASRWADTVQPLLAGGAPEHERARRIAGYYTGMLRANHGRSRYCESPSAKQ